MMKGSLGASLPIVPESDSNQIRDTPSPIIHHLHGITGEWQLRIARQTNPKHLPMYVAQWCLTYLDALLI